MRSTIHRAITLSLTAGFLAVLLLAQPLRRVTIVTTKGDTIEGTLKSVTDVDILIEVAGQPLRVPLETVRYVSFVGILDDAPSKGTDSATPADGALKALKELRTATEVGMLRAQYSEKLVAALSPVLAFAERGPAAVHADVKKAMLLAANEYKAPLATVGSWKNAGAAMARAATWVSYAEALLALKDEETHAEEPGEKTISVGSDVTGRLGFGDAVMARTLDWTATDGFNDNWSLELNSPSRVTIEMSANPCRPHLVLTDESGKKLDSDAAPFDGTARIRKSLTTGRYHIWAGTFDPQVGTYRLSVRPE